MYTINKEENVLEIDIAGYLAKLPIMKLDNGPTIAFFNLHGAQELTEHCGKALAKYLGDCEVVITAESKGLQLAYVVARELGHPYYAVCRKTQKLYMQDGIKATVKSITTGNIQTLYLSRHDMDLIRGKKVAIVDDVISTGGSLLGLEEIVAKAGGIVQKKAFVLAEGDAKNRKDVIYLGEIPLM